MRNCLTGALAALALSWPLAAASDPLTLETLLGLESFGRVVIDPTGAVAVFEERRARGDLPRYDLQPEGALKYAKLYRIDLTAPSAVRPLLPMEADAGYTAGPFSPDGSRLIVFRLQGLTFRLGIVDLENNEVIWTDLSPDSGAWGRSVEWLTNDEFVVVAMPNGELPTRLSNTNATQTLLPGLWARAARGDAAYVSVGLHTLATPPPDRRLWKVDGATGQSTLLSEGPFLDFEASPDGRYIALVQDGPLYPLADPDRTAETRRARSLRLVEVSSGTAFDPPAANDISTSLLAWSPSSEALLVTTLGEVIPRLLSIAPSGAVRDATPVGVTPSVPIDFQLNPTAQAGWLNGEPMVRGVRNGQSGWHLQSNQTVLTLEGLDPDARLVAQGREAALFVSRGRLVRLTPDASIEDLGANSTVVRPDGPFGQRAQTDPLKADSAVAQDEGGRLCRVTPERQPVPCVAGAPGAAISWSRGVSLGPGREGRAVNRLEVRNDGSREVVWRLNPELDHVEVAPPRLVTGPRDARGWLYLPSPEAGPPPVIVIPYPGRANPTPPRTMRPESIQLTLNGLLLVAAGYAVLYPDLPANDEPSRGLADRILAVVDAAASENLVDPGRIGLWGHSFGAWASVLSATQSLRFSAVVALNGAYNLPTSLAGLSPHDRMAGANNYGVSGNARWLEAGQVGMQRSYWSDPERYARGSAFEHADEMMAPVLLIHGEMDSGSGQAELLYAALNRLGRPAALTYLFGEDHSIHNPGNARIYYQQLLEWFDRHVSRSGN